ncbi:MAG: HIT domain-containing protein [Candidatus Omnitrophota bacterium]|jgi:ATP adenylyltransferase
MDRLWAPWRIGYIKKKKKKKGCVFCSALKGNDYVVLKSKYSFALLNIFPYNNGHTMVSPIRHIKELSKLNEKEALDIFHTVNKVKKILDKVLKPHGYNIGMNTSESAGAGEAGHMHIHIVPRWKGDTNFITSLSGTKVISQSLDELHKQMKKAC